MCRGGPSCYGLVGMVVFTQRLGMMILEVFSNFNSCMMGIASTWCTHSILQVLTLLPETEEQLEVSPALLWPMGSIQCRIHSPGSSLKEPKTYGIVSRYSIRQSPKPMDYSHPSELRNLATYKMQMFKCSSEATLLHWRVGQVCGHSEEYFKILKTLNKICVA